MALAYAFGTAISLRYFLSPPLFIAIAAVLAPSAWLLRKRRTAGILIYVAVLALAIAATRISDNRATAKGIAGMMRAPREYALLRGVVAYEPTCYTASGPGRSLCYFSFRVREILRSGEWEDAAGRIRVRLPLASTDHSVRYGDELELQGLLIRNPSSDVSFSSAFRPEMRVSGGGARIVSRDNGLALMALCLRARRAAAAILTHGIPPDSGQAGLIQALLLGYREALDRDVHGKFAATGTVHILAISGLHVGLIAWIIVTFLRWAGIPRTHYFIFLLPLLALYTISTGLRSSAIRACLMAAIYWLAPAIKRKPNALCSLALTAILILIFAPTQILDPGFQFSFMIVAGIIAMVPVFNGFGIALTEADPMRLQEEPPFIAILRTLGRRLYFLAAMTVSSWIISMPLIMYYGNLFSPIALLGNLVVVPLTTIIVAIGATSLLLGSVVVHAAFFVNQINNIFLGVLIAVVELMASVRAGYYNVVAPPLWYFPCYYALVISVFMSRRIRRKAAISAAAATLTIAVMLLPRWSGSNIEFDAYGGINVALLNAKGSGPILVNTASQHHSWAVRRWLNSRGVNRINSVVLTQVDSAHAGGWLEILDSYRVREVWIPNYSSRSPIYGELETRAQMGDLRLRRLHSGIQVELGDGVEFEVFAPLPDREYRSTAEAALVARIAKGGVAVMLVGSASLPSELLRQPRDVAAPIWTLEDFGIGANFNPQSLPVRPELLMIGGSVIPHGTDISLVSLEKEGPVKIRLDKAR